MQLLYSRAAPCPEFVSLSLMLKSEVSGGGLPSRLREPLLLPSPVATISQGTGVEAVKELHLYLLSILKSTQASKEQTNNLGISFLQEDERLLSDIQVFRPNKGQGMALFYKLIRDRSAMPPLTQLVLKSSEAASSIITKGIENDIMGVILCVGMVGLPSAFVMSSLHYSLSQRIKDCIAILSKAGTEDAAASATLLTTILLTDEESRLTNSMATAIDYHLFAEGDDVGRGGLLGGKKKSHDAAPDAEFENPLSLNSADQARLMVERLAVLSVSESDTLFRKFEGKSADKGKSRRRKSGRDADLDGFDFRGEKKSSREAPTAVGVSDASSIKSGGSKLQLKQPKKDTARIAGGKGARQVSVPALMASNKDTGAKNRRPSADQSGKNRALGSNRRPSVETLQSNWTTETASDNQRSQKGIESSRDGSFDPFSATSVGTSSTTSETTLSSRRNGAGAFESGMSEDVGFAGDAFGRDMAKQSGANGRSVGSISERPKLQVNVALNEDLTCFYKLSKMSSCSVEGVIQVQVKTTADQSVPFFLLIRDPSNHIQSIQENKKYAENMVDTIGREPPTRRPDYKFKVSVPKDDNYFPVMRYKCGNELRPVPIRVQTRVRLEGVHWRVALQISSNPHNEDNLTDLTIIMGVPAVVSGESLATSPAGGVWNASKRSVIWCVSELGGGEKFQLQARFEIEPDMAVDDGETPKFPVLVRCQCMYAQLSDVEVDVQDIAEIAPAETRIKLSRRFRLSHRERP